MTKKKIIASILQVGGIAFVASGVGLVCIWGALITLGVGMTAFGIAVERDDS